VTDEVYMLGGGVRWDTWGWRWVEME